MQEEREFLNKMKQFSTQTTSAYETIAFGKKCMKTALFWAEQDTPLIFCLEGELGSGKTHFVKGLAQGLGIRGNITSPTFVLMKKFSLSRRGALEKAGKRLFFHIDCYRIYDSEDARQIGLDKIFENPRGIFAIEWAERIAEMIPKPYWEVKFEHVGQRKRKIDIKKLF